ncbi:sensor histidine kinase [Mesonia sp.]|uniref:sensor histidine kinase n=1 Tax=Mesonia sp. TaxID=1960830 RepID=UPI003F989468
MKPKKNISYRIIEALVHLVFWVGIYFFFTYFLGYGSTNTTYINRFTLFLMPVTMITAYTFSHFLIPRYLIQKKYVWFSLYTVYAFIIASYVSIQSILYALIFLQDFQTGEITPITKSLPFILLGILMVVMLVIVLQVIQYLYSSSAEKEQLERKFLTTELAFKKQQLETLKMQIHPHFLFNSLNTIYGFTLSKRDEAPEMVLKLSNLLDYILYQTQKEKVSLEEELKHVEDYIALEKLRFQDTLEVNLDKQIENPNRQLSPMLFLPFVENSFKHGKIINGQLSVKIFIKENAKKLHFYIENTCDDSVTNTEGIGIKNIQERLNLLYPEKHVLEIKQEENRFIVDLKILVPG